VSVISDPVDALDRDQIILNEVYHSILVDPQPVIVATVEGFRRYGLSANRATATPIARIPA